MCEPTDQWVGRTIGPDARRFSGATGCAHTSYGRGYLCLLSMGYAAEKDTRNSLPHPVC